MGTCQLLRRGLASSLLFISVWAPLVYSYHLEIMETRKVLSEGGLTEPAVTMMREATFPRMSVRRLAILRTIDSLTHTLGVETLTLGKVSPSFCSLFGGCATQACQYSLSPPQGGECGMEYESRCK